MCRPPFPAIVLSILLAGSCTANQAGSPPGGQSSGDPLKGLDLEQLGNVEVTSTSKEPEQVWRTPISCVRCIRRHQRISTLFGGPHHAGDRCRHLLPFRFFGS